MFWIPCLGSVLLLTALQLSSRVLKDLLLIDQNILLAWDLFSLFLGQSEEAIFQIDTVHNFLQLWQRRQEQGSYLNTLGLSISLFSKQGMTTDEILNHMSQESAVIHFLALSKEEHGFKVLSPNLKTNKRGCFDLECLSL